MKRYTLDELFMTAVTVIGVILLALFTIRLVTVGPF